MKLSRIAAFFALILLGFTCCNNDMRAFDTSINPDTDSIYRVKPLPSWKPAVFDAQGRLFYLCKVWGFSTYHGNGFGHKQHIDSLLFRYLDELQAYPDMDKMTFDSMLSDMLQLVCVDSVETDNLEFDMKDYSLITNDWMDDTVYLNEEVRLLLKNTFKCYRGICFVARNNSIGQIRRLKKTTYNDIQNVSVRLFGLFDYWNFINYFYPDKNAMDESWDSVLYVSIPDFISANDEISYRKSIYRLVNHLRDTHASLPATVDTMLFGPYRPNFGMKMIDDTLIISSINDEENNVDRFRIGDVVLQVDGMDAHYLYDSLQQYVCGGNYWSNQRLVCNAVLSRQEKSTQFMILRDKDTLMLDSHNETSVNLYKNRINMLKNNEKEQLWNWIDEDIAYLDLESLTGRNFKKNYSPIRQASVIILDLRNYPDNLAVSDIAQNFVPENSFFAYIVYPDVHWPGKLRYMMSTLFIGSKDCFKGKLIVLVDENTGSFSEYLTMMFQANPNTVVVGSPTSGADGNIDTFVFPGNITTIFTSLGVLYPDLSPTQRTGIRIDYQVEPTISSVKENKDVVLEKGILVARELIEKPN